MTPSDVLMVGCVDRVARVVTRYSKCLASRLVRGNEQGIRTV